MHRVGVLHNRAQLPGIKSFMQAQRTSDAIEGFTMLTAVASIVGMLLSSRTLIIGATLVQMRYLSIHRLIRFLCDRSLITWISLPV